ncbi:MAG: ribonuclease inhibitor [Verrucomicrobiales bacterium]|nr:ribonuclease inhibitor [Verrucomicrobiales bacterium]
MLETFLQFLNFLPAGLLVAAVCLEVFVVSRQDRDSEPAVLWLLCCTAVAGAIAAVLEFTFYFIKIDSGGLRAGIGSGIIAAFASAAWAFKRLARNRSFLLLRERFFDTSNAKLPPRQKPLQAFLIVGYRVVLGLALAAAAGWQLAGPRGGYSGEFSKDRAMAGAPSSGAANQNPDPAALPGGAAGSGSAGSPSPTGSPATTPTTAVVSNPGSDAPGHGTGGVASVSLDPTRAEIPSADASAVAAMATSALTTPAPAPGDAEGKPGMDGTAIPVVAVVPENTGRPVSKNSLYFSKVRPIFAKACVSCHGPQKQKGDLRLDTPDFIRAGVNGKPVIVPGVPDKSRVYHVTGLPQDDTDRMPPKGTPLNSSERAILAQWIKTGADLGDGVSIPAGHDGVFLVDTIAEGLPEPDPRIIEDLKKDHVVIRPLSKNGHVLELDFSHSDRAQSDLKLSQLGPIALHIYALDFSRTKISDADLGQLLPMKNLSRLLLSRTGITDAGLPALRNNTSLEQLNLYNTSVSDAGLATLGSLKSLKKVYLWQSKATQDGAKHLQEQVPGLVVSIGE